jgi:hypothetical protein
MPKSHQISIGIFGKISKGGDNQQGSPALIGWTSECELERNDVQHLSFTSHTRYV